MSFRLGRIYGIPIRIHYTLWLVFLLIVWSLATSYMPLNYPGLAFEEYWLISIVSTAILFLSVLVHELSHSIIAKRNGLPISRITLFFFGGVSEIAQEPDDPWLEVRMAAAGPLTSIGVAILLGGLWLATKYMAAPTSITATLSYSASLNAILAGFNLIPAFPLDGGRVLRGGLWEWSRDLVRATAQATTVSQIISIGMIAVGFLMIIFSDFVNGLWIFFLGWFIRSGALNSLRQTRVTEALSGIMVRDIMTTDPTTISSSMLVQDLINDYFLNRPHRGYPVMSDGKPVGIVTISSVRSVPREQREARTAGEAMVPYEKTVRVEPSTLAFDALQLMTRRGVGRVLVIDGDKLVGILTRGDVMRTLQSREDLG